MGYALRPVFSQPVFSKTFTMGDDDHSNVALGIAPFEDGYLVHGGRRNNAGEEYLALTKIDQNCTPIWKALYDLDNQNSPPDTGFDMVMDDENIYVGCQYMNINQMDLEMVCISRTTLDTVWITTLHNALNDIVITTMTTSDNALLLVSIQDKTGPGTWLRLTKIDKSGHILWDRLWDDFKAYYPRQATSSSDGNILIAFGAVEYGGTDDTGVVKKIALDGTPIWTKKFNHTDKLATLGAVTALQNGDIAFGYIRDTFPPGATLYDFPPTIYLLDSLGDIRLHYAFYSRWLRVLYKLRTLPDGDILGIGEATGHPDTIPGGGWLFRMSPQGELRWQRVIADTREIYGWFNDAILTDDGGILAVGCILKKDSEEYHVWAVKINGNGCYEGDCNNPELLISDAPERPMPDGSKYNVFPNPTQSIIYLSGLSGEEKEVELYETSGRFIQVINFSAAGTLDIGHLQPGHYTLKIILKNNQFTTLNLIKT